MAKIPVSIPDPIAKDPITEMPIAPPLPAPIYPGSGKWFNATRSRWTNTVPATATICPPGSRIYYEAKDPLSAVCVKKYGGSIPIERTPTDFPPDTDPQTPVIADPTLTTVPFQDPPNSFRATSVSQMYRMTSLTGSAYLFHVGVPHANESKTIWFSNDTLNTVLLVKFTLPPYVKILGLTTNEIEISPNVGDIPFTKFEIYFDELAARELSKTSMRTYVDSIVIDVYPLEEIRGPIYITTSPTPLPIDAEGTLPASSTPVDDKWWFNVTQNVYTATKPANAVICPAGSQQYYEVGDPNLQTCLAKSTQPIGNSTVIKKKPPIIIQQQ